MPRKPKPGSRDQDPIGSVVSQRDDADILAEAGAERDKENGGYVIDEDKLRELGSADPGSVRENRRIDRVVEKKRKGETDVPWGTDDPLIIYESLLRMNSPDGICIRVKRLIGSEATQMITSLPLSGGELYEAIQAIHGQQAEIKYEVKFTAVGRGHYLGTGRITMPDTRPQQTQPQHQPQQQGQPMSNNQNGQPPQQQWQQPPQQPAPQQQQPPTVQVMPSSFDPNSMLAMMGQMFEMFKNMQATAQPPPAPVQAPPPQAPVMAMPPLPPPQSSPAEMMAWFQQAFQLFQQTQTAQAAPQPVFQMPAPVQAPLPPSQQSSLAETFEMFERFTDMMERMRPPPPPQAPPYRGPRPPYYPQGEPANGQPYQAPYQQQPSAPPQRQQTPAEQLREAMGVVRTAVDAVREMNSLLPDGQQEPEADPNEDSPIRVFEAGPAKIVVDKKDGTIRGWETAWANSGGVLKWVGEQREAIQKETAARQLQQRPPQQQLPPGYVEVGPGYQPPPGFVAIPIEPQQDPLPPAPVNMPPPIQSTPEPQPDRQTWGAPPIPGENQ